MCQIQGWIKDSERFDDAQAHRTTLKQLLSEFVMELSSGEKIRTLVEGCVCVCVCVCVFVCACACACVRARVCVCVCVARARQLWWVGWNRSRLCPREYVICGCMSACGVVGRWYGRQWCVTHSGR